MKRYSEVTAYEIYGSCSIRAGLFTLVDHNSRFELRLSDESLRPTLIQAEFIVSITDSVIIDQDTADGHKPCVFLLVARQTIWTKLDISEKLKHTRRCQQPKESISFSLLAVASEYHTKKFFHTELENSLSDVSKSFNPKNAESSLATQKKKMEFYKTV